MGEHKTSENKVILQQEVTLDDALLLSFKTFRNGCNFKLRKDKNERFWLEYGCDCLVNLLTDHEKLVSDFLAKSPPMEKIELLLDGIAHPSRRIDHIVSNNTIDILLLREPCKRCGGAIFYNK